MITKPMLAASVTDINQLRFPLLATPKIDGIRCLVIDGHAVTRTLKPIPNRFVRSYIESNAPNGFDGELVCPGGFQVTTSRIMSHDGLPPFAYRVFDYVQYSRHRDYIDRVFQDLKKWFDLRRADSDNPVGAFNIVMPDIVRDLDDLLAYEAAALEEGYEGVCLRTPSSPYKCGRSTWNEHWLLKLKRFLDSEAEIVEVEELYHNENAPETNALGLTERSDHQANMVPGNTMGALRVRDLKGDFVFSVGSGFTALQRRWFWDNRQALTGHVITYKYQPHGVKNLPRHPVYKGLRDRRDIS